MEFTALVPRLVDREHAATKNDRLVSRAYPAMISVANLHSIRLDTSQNNQIGRIKGSGVEDSLPHHRRFLGAEVGSAVFIHIEDKRRQIGNLAVTDFTFQKQRLVRSAYQSLVLGLERRTREE